MLQGMGTGREVNWKTNETTLQWHHGFYQKSNANRSISAQETNRRCHAKTNKERRRWQWYHAVASRSGPASGIIWKENTKLWPRIYFSDTSNTSDCPPWSPQAMVQWQSHPPARTEEDTIVALQHPFNIFTVIVVNCSYCGPILGSFGRSISLSNVVICILLRHWIDEKFGYG